MDTGRANSIEIDIERLWRDLDASALIGPGRAGGLRRLALTDEDKAMRDVFVAWCESAGCQVRVDAVGNIFARRGGLDDTLPAILIGSHLDTQIAGGRYDGILGVLAGLEIIRTLNDHGVVTRRPIELVTWTNEEGVRFQPPMMGSGAFTGAHDVAWVHAQLDDDRKIFAEELSRIGYLRSAQPLPEHYDSYFELHIEQGETLDAEGLHVGIVTGGFRTFGTELRVTGENAHSGPTPMRRRSNALVGASLLIARLNDIGWTFEPEGRTTCSRLLIEPNRYGIIPHSAKLTVDMRHPDDEKAREMYQEFLDFVPLAARKANVGIEIAKEWSFGDVVFDSRLINLVRSVAADLGVSHRHLLSAASHDAYNVAKVIPTVMIFTPCREGISHNEKEHIEPSYTAPGVNVLLNAVLRRANA
ncbi:Zn-dependent hydrolase [Nordella sp. HKS 07]|uniref:Zn-dependent hydrolase n=1 Tax=Nordella sp. HKS 07 TaxID=2712222 RepID=UPI0013E137DA|nr:Zn-dependent hydrolase [Nordella sp. HKS 07]QIG49107.1 Zn-dependent hydrolase [Nordella sp. HKS 07]